MSVDGGEDGLMKAATTAIFWGGCFAVCSACAQTALHQDSAFVTGLADSYPAGRNASGTSWQPDSTPATATAAAAGDGKRLMPAHSSPRRMPQLSASYHFELDSQSSLFGYVGEPGEPALGPPVSYMRRFSGFDSPDPSLSSHWLDATHDSERVLTLGYEWQRVKVEGSAFAAHKDDEPRYADNDLLEFNSTSGRLSFNPWPNWSFQMSKGRLGGLDQLEPDADIRRTTISATYNHRFRRSDWQTTLAWGRNARKDQEPVMGYLLESTLRFNGTHAIFGRLEQVGSDELPRENEALQRRMFKMSRITVGYFHHVRAAVGPGFDVGGFASRHLVPSSMTPIYGNDPTSYMMFVRLKFQ